MGIIQRIKAAIPAPKVKKAGVASITPVQLLRIVQDAQTRKDAMSEAERAYFPFRYKMQQLFLNTYDNGHVKACFERRKDLTLLRDWYFGENGIPNDDVTNTFKKTWFNTFLSYSLDTLAFGYSLIQLNDLVDNGFPNIQIVKRWNVSPDRFEVAQYPMMPTGVKFLEDPTVKDWYVYINTPNDFGVSPCGYGLLWDVSVYEIFMRNLLGFNGTFVELFAQPIRWGKSSAIEGPERDLLEQALKDMGSSAYILTDPMSEVQLLESNLGGTGYKAYDNLEARLQKLISKVILGHADAIDSTPGKLGSGNNQDNPVSVAMRDKQVKDASFIENVVNDLLLPRMRSLGFNIPDTCLFCFKNDAEIMDNAHNVTDLAVKIKTAGLQMDDKYFTDQTGIPVIIPTKPPTLGGSSFNKNVQNKLNILYK